MSEAEIKSIFHSIDRIEQRLLKLQERDAMRRGNHHEYPVGGR